MSQSILSLNEIMSNDPRELEVTGFGTVKVRDPTVDDKIKAREEAKKDSRWAELNEAEKNALILDLLSLKLIVDPKISVENYYTANSVKLSNIISSVIMDYTVRHKKMQDKRQKEIDIFLEAVKESNQ